MEPSRYTLLQLGWPEGFSQVVVGHILAIFSTPIPVQVRVLHQHHTPYRIWPPLRSVDHNWDMCGPGTVRNSCRSEYEPDLPYDILDKSTRPHAVRTK